MSEPLCKPCEQKGVKRKAHRMSKPPMCNECYADSLGEARPTNVVLERLVELRKERQAAILTETEIEKPKEQVMPTGITAKIDWAQVQRERNEGVSVEVLRKKYNTSWLTVRAHTMPPPESVARKLQTKTKASAPTAYKPAKVKRTGSGYDSVLEELRTKRDQLNSAISAIEALG